MRVCIILKIKRIKNFLRFMCVCIVRNTGIYPCEWVRVCVKTKASKSKRKKKYYIFFNPKYPNKLFILFLSNFSLIRNLYVLYCFRPPFQIKIKSIEKWKIRENKTKGVKVKENESKKKKKRKKKETKFGNLYRLKSYVYCIFFTSPFHG